MKLLILIILSTMLLSSCTSVKNVACKGNKRMMYSQGYSAKSFKF